MERNILKRFFSKPVSFKVNHKKYVLKRKFDRILKFGLISIISLILLLTLYNFINQYFTVRDSGTLRVDFYKDLNVQHLKYARKNGISGFSSNRKFRENLDDLLDRDKLEKVENSRYYVVKKLTHSHPYLTPKAVDLLKLIGKRFQDKLDENNLPNYRYQISSLLRTGESQKGLSHSNSNASSNSSHLYGTTFDISYKKLIKRRFPGINIPVTDGYAIRLLSKTIGELRKEGKCVVVTERREACFHITVR